jgi:tRNA A37 threonylcarbamoyladenosine modification protein TsaB
VLRTQNAYSVAQVALALYESGVRTSDQELVPVYLRPCQAERERMERLEKENSIKQ